MAWVRSNKKGSGGGVKVLDGTTQPSSSQGYNGQMYLKHLPDLSSVNIRESISNSAVGDYFDTGYLFNENTRIETKFKIPSSVSSYNTPFGCRISTSTGNEPHQLFFTLNNAGLYFAFGGAQSFTNDFFTYNSDAIVETLGSVLKMQQNSNIKYAMTEPYSTSGTKNLYLFCANADGSPWANSYCVMTLYYFKIYEGDILMHYYLPALDTNDEPCLYDCITGTYLYNQGSGTLTVGNALTVEKEITNAYAKVNDAWQDLIGTDVDDVNTEGKDIIVTPVQITDVSEFTKLYSTSYDENYGSLGTRVSDALSLTNEKLIEGYMSLGWYDSHACFYDSEDKKGAYAGYNFGKPINLSKAYLWIGKYVEQNKSLYVTVQVLDSQGNWTDVVDLDVSASIGYPIYCYEVDLNRECYGIRWIHKNGENKTSGNNIVFFGMSLYEYVADDIRSCSPLIPKMTSNTAPSGVASASTEYSSTYYAYKAFDRSYQSLWGSADSVTTGQWIKYDFGSVKQVNAFSVTNRDNLSYSVGELVLQGSLNDTDWTDIKTIRGLVPGEIACAFLDKPCKFRYYRWYILSNSSGSSNMGTGFVELQLYGKND